MGSSAASPTVRAVVFDYGGVLTTPTRDSINAWLAEERIRPELFSAALKEWLSRNAPAGTPVHLLETGELDADGFNKALAARLRTFDDEPVPPDDLLGRLFGRMRPEPAMLTLVRDLRERGIRTALLSNSWGNIDSYPWEQLAGLFDSTVLSGEVGLRKPDPRIYRMSLDALGLDAAQTAFVDDGAPNVDAARDLGIHAVLHTGPAETRARLAELLPAGSVPQDEETR
ncbi:HAD family hydrolase [Saccharopolyspora mangrovi]|uniref:HAD family phosphatase n=1 Tax=Saccharopolyspora mangrovi TaxID=3082379 RepID=A0ABU6AHY8_9PSEU|nr:HAD family phosphatase [Saccharopolyspora sp. S2-29]MEB3371068.1 HAD family phosphatase [Saccharopolyspora sp. S2-29]